jgi:hypothetical protein
MVYCPQLKELDLAYQRYLKGGRANSLQQDRKAIYANSAALCITCASLLISHSVLFHRISPQHRILTSLHKCATSAFDFRHRPSKARSADTATLHSNLVSNPGLIRHIPESLHISYSDVLQTCLRGYVSVLAPCTKSLRDLIPWTWPEHRTGARLGPKGRLRRSRFTVPTSLVSSKARAPLQSKPGLQARS